MAKTKIKEIPKVETPPVQLPSYKPKAPINTKLDVQPKYGTVAVDVGGGRSIVAPRAMAEQMAAKGQGVIQTPELSQEKAKLEEAQQLAEQVGNVPGLTPEREAELQAEISPEAQFREGLPGALREGTTQAVSRGLQLGAAGAAVGLAGGPAAPITVPVGVGLGVAAGVISGYWSAIRSSTKAEAKEDVGNIMSEFTQLRKGMTNSATLLTSSQMNGDEAVELYNAQYSRMLELQAQLKYLTDSDLKDYLSDGSGDLITVTTFLEEVAPNYKARIQTALLNPSSTTVPYSSDYAGEED